MTGTSFGGDWTEEKLKILERYLDAYTTALKNQPFHLIYVDAFAGEGYWRPNTPYTREDYGDFENLRDGSPRIALKIEDKPFDKLVFIEKDDHRRKKLCKLRQEFSDRNLQIKKADANEALPTFCKSLGNYERAVVFLDPFATQVSWKTVSSLAETKKIDCWILFPSIAIARMMPKNEEPSKALAANLDRIFGGRKPWKAVYQRSPQLTLFNNETTLERPSGTDRIADNYRSRLEEVFEKVAPTRRILKNSRKSPMFELFFAASNPHGATIAIDIADHILKHW